MGGFLSSIFTGANPTLNGDIGNAGNVMGFGTSVGEGDTRTASDFLTKIMGGDPAAISRLLGPQIKASADRANQQIQTEGEFGNRSGGTNAANQHIMDSTRGNIDDSISHLTGSAVGELGSMGQNLLNTGLKANQLQDEESQQKLENQQQSLLGGIISKGVSHGLSPIFGGI